PESLLSRTPHVLSALVAALVIAVSSPAVARKRTQITTRSPSPAALAASRPVANVASISTNAAPVARQFDRWLDGIETSGDVAGLAVAVVKDDKVLLERTIGYAETTTREPITANTAFRLASLSKAFATALTAK